MFNTFWSLFKYPICLVVAVLAVFGCIFAFSLIKEYAGGSRLKKGIRGRSNRPKSFKFLYLASKQFAKDFFSRSPEYFRHQGVVVFCGRQGSGKTVALVEQTQCWQNEYPLCHVIGNLDYAGQTDSLNDWRQLVDYGNGIQGVIVQIDEMQNWFSSNQSKNFSPEMLEVVTQNRKNRRVILGTSQVFCRLAKPLREQVTEVRNCFTFFGCFTVVHRVAPDINSEGAVEKYRHLGWYCFPHTAKIRNAYDTYKVIESLSKSGFQPRSETILSSGDSKTNLTITA